MQFCKNVHARARGPDNFQNWRKAEISQLWFEYLHFQISDHKCVKICEKKKFMCLAHLTSLEPTSSSVDVRGKTSQLLSRNMKAGLPSPANLLSKYYSQMSPLLFFLSLILEVFAKHLKSRQHPWFRRSVFLQNLATIVTSWTKTDLYKQKTFCLRWHFLA